MSEDEPARTWSDDANSEPPLTMERLKEACKKLPPPITDRIVELSRIQLLRPSGLESPPPWDKYYDEWQRMFGSITSPERPPAQWLDERNRRDDEHDGQARRGLRHLTHRISAEDVARMRRAVR